MTDRAARNIAIMTAAFDALNRRDLDACVAMLTPDFEINVAGSPGQLRGTKAWRKNAEILIRAVPDSRVHVEDIFATDDKVAVRIRMTGTHQGDFLGLPPSGKKVDYESNELYSIDPDGRISAEWICSDLLTFMTQIGVYPASHLFGLWIASFKVWIAAAAGFALGAAIFALV